MARKPPKIAGTTCASCGVSGPIQLTDDICAACQSAAAWATYAAAPLVIDRTEAQRALQQSQVRPGRLAWLFHGSLALLTLGMVALTIVATVAAVAPISIGGLDDITASIARSASRAKWLGLLCFAIGIVGAIALRRSRKLRSVPLLAVHSAAIVIGLTGGVIGIVQGLGASSDHLPYVSMPSIEQWGGLALTPDVARIVDSTVVVLAPDKDGDARYASIGTGAIISSQADHAWVITCSHVAIPNIATGSVRDPAKTNPVWIEFSDGRGAEGTVVWAAAPPLDVVVISIAINNPPPAVSIAPSTANQEQGRPVVFVPNPLLHGWQVHYGNVEARVSHNTPAGTYALLVTSLPVQPGDSGSGLYDDQGNLIGLNTWANFDANGSRGISLPSEVLRSLEGAIASGNLHRLAPPSPTTRNVQQ